MDFLLIHADESCLGNQNAGASRGGAGALLETNHNGTIIRQDLYISSPDTTNNRMALEGAIVILDLLTNEAKGRTITYISDSQYLVKGITTWIKGWKAKGWKRSGGAVENLELWQALDTLNAKHHTKFEWVRGHAGHAKNEFVDFLAVRAAESQTRSNGLSQSAFIDWLAKQQATGKFAHYDPDASFLAKEQERLGGRK